MFRNLKYFSYLISVTHLNDLDAEKKIKKKNFSILTDSNFECKCNKKKNST